MLLKFASALLVLGIGTLVYVGMAKITAIIAEENNDKDDQQHDSFPPMGMGGAAV